MWIIPFNILLLDAVQYVKLLLLLPLPLRFLSRPLYGLQQQRLFLILEFNRLIADNIPNFIIKDSLLLYLIQ